MKINELKDKVFLHQSARAGLMLVIVAVVTLEATALIQFYFSQKGIKAEASMRAESQLEATRLKIMNVIDQAESAVRNSEWIAQWCLDYPDSMVAVTRRIVRDNPVIVGSTLALVPGYNPARPLYAPFSYQIPGEKEIHYRQLATQEYDYPSQEWFVKPLELQAGYWSEPYVDEGGADLLMTTYSLPVRDKNGRLAAVLTADVSLDWLTDLVGNVEVYPTAFSMMISRSGQIMVCPVESLVMRKTVQETLLDLNASDTSKLGSINRSMMSGESGNVTLKYQKSTSYIFYAPVERTGWSMSIVIPDEEIFGGIRRIGLIVKLLQLLGVLMLILILRSSIKSQLKYRELSERKEKMESELKIGRGIQMSMLPKIFPPFPERKDIDMFASIVPAKEVGGDLYDFYIRENKLFFCIGDVSGKGVPASLVMAVTRSLFRTVSAHEKSPQRIVTAMNESMADMNESNMFVTFFTAVLDLGNGHMRYCNCGHNAPYVISSEGVSALDVMANLPLGVMPGMSFQEQETDLRCGDGLFLFTDGLTEAENSDHELFGENRLLGQLHPGMVSQEQLRIVSEAIGSYVGTAPQSDDLTMLYVRYLNETVPDNSERHLILHNDIQQIPQLADFVETIAEEARLDQSLAMSLNLALEEAVTNVIMYAYPEGSDGLVDVEAVIRKDSLEFIVSDSGQPFDPTRAPEVDVTLGVEERAIGGLGIYLVRNIMDEVRYERTEGKNVFSMIKFIG
ncbi:MAG: SpoIIE family protein phosphatase [Bacteroidales bacterium]|nr:SpoIIE family protein phosphatase [Bacteroidales bacterium]